MHSFLRAVAVLLLASPAAALAEAPSPPAAASPAKPAAPAAAKPIAPEVGLHALGAASAQNLRMLQLSPAEIEIVKRGFGEALASPKPLAPPADAAGFDAFVRQRYEAAAKANKESGKAFAAKAAAEKGAQKTASGAVYSSIADGSGASPKRTDIVKVDVRGALTDGTVFDSGATQFSMNGTIPCFSEGIAKMKAGGKARLVCPPETAFGDQGRPPNIPPGATLVFDVTLISAEAAPAMSGHGADLPAGHPAVDAPKTSGGTKAGSKKKK